jgi:DNA-binding CsgD family transcriptional regulator
VSDHDEHEIEAPDAHPSPYPRGGRRRAAWSRNPAILKRLSRVERLRGERLSNVAIASRLGVNEGTVRDDLERLRQVWENQLGDEMLRLRAEAVADMDNVVRTTMAAIRADQHYTQAVLFGVTTVVTCAGGMQHQHSEGVDPNTSYGEVWSCIAPHKVRRRVYRDERGSATYRSNIGQLLQVVRQTNFDKAKIMGLVVNKQAATTGDGVDLKTTMAALLTGELDEEQFAEQSVRRKAFMPSLPEPDVADADDDDWEVWTP